MLRDVIRIQGQQSPGDASTIIRSSQVMRPTAQGGHASLVAYQRYAQLTAMVQLQWWFLFCDCIQVTRPSYIQLYVSSITIITRTLLLWFSVLKGTRVISAGR